MKSKEGRLHMSKIMSSLDVIEKRKETCLEKYGVDNVLTVSDILEKRCLTLKKNGTSKISKEEVYLYNILKEIFDIDDIKTQYKSVEYPFCCDFYIESEKLYIEYHGSYFHLGHLFNCDDINDLLHLEELKLKSYKNVIYTWTDLDVRKRKIAELNNLNIIFLFPDFCNVWKHYCYTMNKFGNDIDNIKELIIEKLKNLIYEQELKFVGNVSCQLCV